MADERRGCVVQFTDRRSGGERAWGCFGEASWTMSQPIDTLKLVSTFEEAVLSPIFDETFAVARAQTIADLRGWNYKIVVPAAGKMR
jgi:hypothetical protein